MLLLSNIEEDNNINRKLIKQYVTDTYYDSLQSIDNTIIQSYLTNIIPENHSKNLNDIENIIKNKLSNQYKNINFKYLLFILDYCIKYNNEIVFKKIIESANGISSELRYTIKNIILNLLIIYENIYFIEKLNMCYQFPLNLIIEKIKYNRNTFIILLLTINKSWKIDIIKHIILNQKQKLVDYLLKDKFNHPILFNIIIENNSSAYINDDDDSEPNIINKNSINTAFFLFKKNILKQIIKKKYFRIKNIKKNQSYDKDLLLYALKKNIIDTQKAPGLLWQFSKIHNYKWFNYITTMIPFNDNQEIYHVILPQYIMHSKSKRILKKLLENMDFDNYIQNRMNARKLQKKIYPLQFLLTKFKLKLISKIYNLTNFSNIKQIFSILYINDNVKLYKKFIKNHINYHLFFTSEMKTNILRFLVTIEENTSDKFIKQKLNMCRKYTDFKLNIEKIFNYFYLFSFSKNLPIYFDYHLLKQIKNFI